MSNSKSAISEIKKLMVQFGFLSAEPTLLDFKLEDHTILQAEAIEVGKSVYKINELFEKVTLEDGTYNLENFEIEVADGKISKVKEEFVAGKLKDGTQVEATGKGFQVGGKLFVVKDGTSVPAPDGEHELEDGTQVSVKDGEIVALETAAEQNSPEEKGETPAEEAKESPAEQGEESQSPVDEKTNKEDAKLNPQHYDEMYNMLKEFVTKAHEKINQMEEQYSALNEQFEAFRKEPAGQKIKYSNTENFAKVDSNVDARVANILSLRNKK
jgi:hypothetical protein